MAPKSALAARLAAREKKLSRNRFRDDDAADGFNDEDMMANLTSTEDAGLHSHHQNNTDDATSTNNRLKKASSFLPSTSAMKKKQSLQKRGPLTEELSSGKYAARVRSGDDDDDGGDYDDAAENDFNEDDFYANGGDDDDDFPVAAKRGGFKKSTSRMEKKDARNKKRGRVGFAAADESEIEAKLEDVDDIFGMLDAASDDEDLIAGAANEEEIAERFEMKKRDPTMRARKIARKEVDGMTTGAVQFEDDDDEARQLARAKDEDKDILQQIADLRKRQAEEKSGVAIEETVGAAEQIRQAASLLGSTFSHLLRLRLRLQPALSNALQFPQFYSLPEFATAEKKTYSSLAKEMRSTLTEALDAVGGGHSDRIVAFVAAGEENTSKNKKIDIDATYENYVRLVDQPARRKIDATIDAVGKRVVLGPTAQKNKSDKVADLPLLDQIRGVLTGLTRLYNRAQKNRSHTMIYGHPAHRNDNSNNNNNNSNNSDAERKRMIAMGDVDEEIFDDSDFARELIQRNVTFTGMNSASNNNTGNSNAADLALLKQSTNKSTRKGFHRKTKGRSVSYDPRPKLVGFMVPVPCTQEDHQREALFKNIFADS